MEARACPAGAPVVDYFDPNSPEYPSKRLQWFEDARRSAGPVFWTPNGGGYWAVIGYEELLEAAKDWETFSSKALFDANGEPEPVDGVAYLGLFTPPKIGPSLPLIEDDPPRWEKLRETLAPAFALPAIERWRPRIQTLVDACLDRHIESGRMDLAIDLFNIVPAIFSLEFVGADTTEYRRIARARTVLSHLANDDPRRALFDDEIALEYQAVQDAIEARKPDRRKDLVSHMLNARDKGAPFTDATIFELGTLIIGAGVDTTASVLGSSFIELSLRPDLRERLAANPGQTVKAFEEFVRFGAPTQGLSRTATRDVELGGQKIRKGDRVMLCYGASCRDPREFANPAEVDLDRKPLLHSGFGGGIHRCIGSLFARLEFEIILNTVLRRMPDIRVEMDGVEEFANVAIVTGFEHIPATFTPGVRVGADPQIPGWAQDDTLAA
jgi:cytochrome P450